MVEATAWGPGAEWALDSVPALLGDGDDPAGFVPHHPVVREAWRRHAGWRVPRTGLVLEALAPAVLEQKVTGHEAWRGWRLLVRKYGEPAPGPDDGSVRWACVSRRLPTSGRGCRRGSGTAPASTSRGRGP